MEKTPQLYLSNKNLGDKVKTFYQETDPEFKKLLVQVGAVFLIGVGIVSYQFNNPTLEKRLDESEIPINSLSYKVQPIFDSYIDNFKK